MHFGQGIQKKIITYTCIILRAPPPFFSPLEYSFVTKRRKRQCQAFLLVLCLWRIQISNHICKVRINHSLCLFGSGIPGRGFFFFFPFPVRLRVLTVSPYIELQNSFRDGRVASTATWDVERATRAFIRFTSKRYLIWLGTLRIRRKKSEERNEKSKKGGKGRKRGGGGNGLKSNDMGICRFRGINHMVRW